MRNSKLSLKGYLFDDACFVSVNVVLKPDCKGKYEANYSTYNEQNDKEMIAFSAKEPSHAHKLLYLKFISVFLVNISLIFFHKCVETSGKFDFFLFIFKVKLLLKG
jgi:hypothetical protein